MKRLQTWSVVCFGLACLCVLSSVESRRKVRDEKTSEFRINELLAEVDLYSDLLDCVSVGPTCYGYGQVWFSVCVRGKENCLVFPREISKQYIKLIKKLKQFRNIKNSGGEVRSLFSETFNADVVLDLRDMFYTFEFLEEKWFAGFHDRPFSLPKCSKIWRKLRLEPVCRKCAIATGGISEGYARMFGWGKTTLRHILK